MKHGMTVKSCRAFCFLCSPVGEALRGLPPLRKDYDIHQINRLTNRRYIRVDKGNLRLISRRRQR